VQKTANEVKAIGKEVKGIFGWIERLFSSPDDNKAVQQTAQPSKKKSKREVEEFDPTVFYAEISKNLTAFYKAYNTLKNHIEEEEQRSKTVYDPSGDQTEKAINRVLAMTRMEEMSVELREYMIYHVPPELKDLYTRVNKMISTVQQEQAFARKEQLKKRKELEIERAEAEHRRLIKGASTIAVIFIAIYFMGLMWAINRMSHGDI
jgi:hypothetical protein